MLREYISDPEYVTGDGDTIFSLLADRAASEPDGDIAEYQDDERVWHTVSAASMLARVREVAKGLIGLGVRPGTMVAIYSATCYEWGVVDFACAAIGAVSVPIYETDSERQAASIIMDTAPLIAFAGDHQHAQTLEQVRDQVKDLKYIFNFRAAGLDAVAEEAHS